MRLQDGGRGDVDDNDPALDVGPDDTVQGAGEWMDGQTDGQIDGWMVSLQFRMWFRLRLNAKLDGLSMMTMMAMAWLLAFILTNLLEISYKDVVNETKLLSE